MSVLSIILIGIGLSMDALAVTIAKTIAECRISKQEGLLMVSLFGLFQGLMPVLGWLIGINFENYITSIDHWIAFVLLAAVGGKMIADHYHQDYSMDCRMDFKTLVILAIATSIDALAIGVSLAFLTVNIIEAALIIAAVTFVICFGGLLIGRRCGVLLQEKADLAGGSILIFMGLKILLEHLLS